MSLDGINMKPKLSVLDLYYTMKDAAQTENKETEFDTLLLKSAIEEDLNMPERCSPYDKLCGRTQTRNQAPYSYMSDENGIINYNGVIFVCDNSRKTLCLGDMSEGEDILTVKLPSGGCIKINSDNFGDITKAMKMFTPEDLNAILSAIAQKKKCESVKFEKDEVILDIVKNL